MPVAQSSHLQAYDYDPEKAEMTVQFQNGSVYRYFGVPQTVYDSFKQQGGAGSYFWSNIRSKYSAQQLSGPDRGGGRVRRMR